MSKVTIKDLAKMLSISVSTVSRALSDHPDINEDTRQRVKAVASRFNYMPNLHARYFRKKNTKMIALILPGFNRFFVPNLIEGIQKVIDENDYRLIIFQTANDPLLEADIIKYCLSWVVEGVLISLADNTNSLSHLDILKESGIPVVILDKILKSDLYPTVAIDDQLAAANATRALINGGKRNILGVFSHENVSITKERLNGFSMELEKHQLPFFEQNYLFINDISNGRQLFEDRLHAQSFDGVVFVTDELLVHCYHSILSYEQVHNQKLGVVSISDGTSPYFLTPNVTHIFHSGFEVGKIACNLLMEHISDQNMNVRHLQIETELVRLGSE